LWVVPSPYAIADVDSTGTLAVGTGTSVSVPTAGKIALRAFEGMEGHRAAIRITGGTASSYVYLFSPFGTVLGSAPASPDGFVDTVSLRSTATFSIVFDPTTTSATSATLTIYDVPPDFASAITTGNPVTAAITTPGQNGLLTFSGTSGQRISLAGTAGTILGQILACDVNVSILEPDKSPFAGLTCMEGDGFIDVVTLPVTGPYSIVVDPVSTATGSLTLTLYDVPADSSGTIAAGGSAVTVAATTPGQNPTLTFSGTTGQKVSLQGTNGTISGRVIGCDVNVSILKPDGSVLVGLTCMEGSGFIDVTTLPVTGTYTIVVDLVSTGTGSLTLTLYEVPADISGTITAGGSSVTVTTATPGQNAALTFAGTAGQRISLLGTNATYGGTDFVCDVDVSIVNPDSSVLAATCMEGGKFIDVKTLPATGTYTVKVAPVGASTGSLTLTLYAVPADISGTITAGGSAVTVTTTAPGQNGALTFSGTANQLISLQGTGIGGQLPFDCDVNVTILKPDSSVLLGTCTEVVPFVMTTLPTTGVYTIIIDPVSTVTGSLTLTLYDVPADASATVTVGGPSATLTTSTPGQNAQATFSGTAGQQITVHLTSNSMGTPIVRLLKPDGSQLTAAASSAANFDLQTQTLPTTGTYTITIDPQDASVGSITVAVTNP
jgi:hypothetical protein